MPPSRDQAFDKSCAAPKTCLDARDSDASIDMIVNRVRSGDAGAFAEIVSQFHGSLRAYVASRSTIGADPDGVIQQVFLKALEQLERYQIGTSFRAWLLAIARYEVLTETAAIRRELQARSRYGLLALHESISRVTRVADGLDDSPDQLVAALRACLGDLPPFQQQLLKLRYEDGRTACEIADSSNRTEGAIRKQLFSIRNQVRLCIKRRGLGLS